MLNVVYDNVVFSLQKSGGISVYWAEITKRVLKNSSVMLKILEYPGAENNIFRKSIRFAEHQVTVMNAFPSIKILRYINPRIKTNGNIIFHSSYYRTAKGQSITNIVTVHDFTYEKEKNNIVGQIHIFQKKNALKNADIIICISENTKKDMLALYPSLIKKKIQVIHNGFNSNDYYYDNNTSVEDTALFVGARGGYKNFDKAVAVVSETNAISLTIVGAPLEPHEKLLLDKKLPNRYQVFTHVSNQELNKIYNKSICLLYLSEYEGFGIPILEAMSAGCPVIALKKSSIPEVAGDAGILFANFDRALIKEAIEMLRDNEKLRLEQIELGLKNAKKFSWDKCYEEVLTLYKEVN